MARKGSEKCVQVLLMREKMLESGWPFLALSLLCSHLTRTASTGHLEREAADSLILSQFYGLQSRGADQWFKRLKGRSLSSSGSPVEAFVLIGGHVSLPIMMQRRMQQNHLNESEPENYFKSPVLAFKQQSLIRTAFCNPCVCTPGKEGSGLSLLPNKRITCSSPAPNPDPMSLG